ncbi:phosphoribosylaminoimidazole carboxylase, chloroplastic-like [Gossypium australe]|uniref:phosphoribosylaminoimidazole carboxylase n=1 Tax=Gossypium australe TaxID=47621 RepID=A0A5B6VUM8_9ROSI|nr:phosphoribosylaminoimidazole carboxylase, chloroplastic-like [Gossypium australe]
MKSKGREGQFLSQPPPSLSLRFFSVSIAADNRNRNRNHRLRHSSYSSKLYNPIFAFRASRDSHETDSSRSSCRKDIVGVLGGGQLGRMLCQVASKMAIKVMVLDPSENCPASALVYAHMVGSFDATVEEFAKRCGVLTVEIEHMDVATLEKLEQQGIDCEPKASTIRIIQDKYLQKVHFSRHGIPLPEFMEINNLIETKRAGELYGYPLMIKSKRLAYDGRGNVVAKSEGELSSAIDDNYYLFIDILLNCTDIAFRSWLSLWQEEEITLSCAIQLLQAPADVPWRIRKLANDVAYKAISSLEGAGVFAVELFLTRDGQILLNEVAPRPHNSGHHTIESCYTSQFEQHLWAVVGLPLGDPSMKTPAAIMYNLLGEDEGEPGFKVAHQLIARALEIPGATTY